MSRRLIVLLGVVVCMICASQGSSVVAAVEVPPQPKGLLVTPVRQEVKVTAGSTSNESLVVANLTDATLDINLEVKSFSVTDFTYDYRFSNVNDNWVTLEQNKVSLVSGESRTLRYTVNPGAKAAPGGYYYTVVVSTKYVANGLPSTVQAASLLYVIVNGDLVQTGRIDRFDAPKLVFSRQFDVSIDTTNTGNVYYFASLSGRVKGLFAGSESVAPNYLLMPNKIRRVSNVIQSPVVPGIYPIEVEYTTDTGTAVRASQWVLFLPFWSIATLIGILLVINIVRNRRRPKTSVSSSQNQ